MEREVRLRAWGHKGFMTIGFTITGRHREQYKVEPKENRASHLALTLYCMMKRICACDRNER
jgi:hypothetical protein